MMVDGLELNCNQIVVNYIYMSKVQIDAVYLNDQDHWSSMQYYKDIELKYCII